MNLQDVELLDVRIMHGSAHDLEHVQFFWLKCFISDLDRKIEDEFEVTLSRSRETTCIASRLSRYELPMCAMPMVHPGAES